MYPWHFPENGKKNQSSTTTEVQRQAVDFTVLSHVYLPSHELFVQLITQSSAATIRDKWPVSLK